MTETVIFALAAYMQTPEAEQTIRQIELIYANLAKPQPKGTPTHDD